MEEGDFQADRTDDLDEMENGIEGAAIATLMSHARTRQDRYTSVDIRGQRAKGG